MFQYLRRLTSPSETSMQLVEKSIKNQRTKIGTFWRSSSWWVPWVLGISDLLESRRVHHPREDSSRPHGTSRIHGGGGLPVEQINTGCRPKISGRSKLRPETTTLVISDTNLKLVTEEEVPDTWHLEVFSWAKPGHIYKLVEELGTSAPNNRVTSVGINHRSHQTKTP